MTGEAIKIFEHDLLAMRDDLLPVVRSRIADRRSHEAEIFPLVICPDVETISEMIEVILVVLLAGQQEFKFFLRAIRGEITHLARRRTHRCRDDISLAASLSAENPVQFVLLFI